MKFVHEKFNVFSLLDWLEIARKADIPHIPVIDSMQLTFQDLEKDAVDFSAFRNLKPGVMSRWDFAGSSDLKMKMDQYNKTLTSEDAEIMHPSDDIRFMNTVMDYVASDTTKPMLDVPLYVVTRPWEDALIENGYPVEYRVFVEEGQVVGVSSYYLQRPLQVSRKRCSEMYDCLVYTEALIDKLPAVEDWGNYGRLPKPELNFTADFLVSSSKGVMYLEGGPGHYVDGGAHPCCFVPGQTYGIALSSLFFNTSNAK